MSLNRIWIPSPNYSASRNASRLLVIHTAEGARTFRDLGNFFAQASRECSSQVGIDDTPNQIGEYVRPEAKAWAAFAANDWGEHAELCGFAGWSRDEWLQHPVMLNNTTAWLQEESARYGIPLVHIDGNAIRAGQSGVCGHADVVAGGAGGDHWDPGPNFPWDVVLTGVAAPVAVPSAPVPAPPPPPPPTQPTPPQSFPQWPGRLLLNTTPMLSGADVTMWQQQMANRGWSISVDGFYGPASETVCRQFQAEKGLPVDGIVGVFTWTASWTAPIT
jgi:Putative peptidoglycan binding domain/N-acetylmuramoyl-L-alanine amidase